MPKKDVIKEEVNVKPSRSKSRAKKSLSLVDGVVTLSLEFSDGSHVEVSDHKNFTQKLIGKGLLSIFSHVISKSKTVEEASEKCSKIASDMSNGLFPSQKRGRVSSVKKVDYLAEAVAEVRNVTYAEAKEWLDSKEVEAKGSKLKVRKHPDVAAALLRNAKARGDSVDNTVLE